MSVLIVGSVLTLGLGAIGAAVPTPYAALGPGVTYNTLDDVNGTEVISFTGNDIPASVNETFAHPGHLNMTTISVFDSPTLFAALGLWGTGDYSIVPREDVFPPDQTVEQVNERNAELFRESQSAAEIAALEYLDYPNVVYAGNIIDGSPSAGKLQTQDRIVSVGGTKVTDAASLQQAMAGTKPGQSVTIGVDRGGTPMSVTVTLGKRPDNEPRGFLGIEPQQRPYAPFTAHISLDKIGGPSAGLMFTLGLIDKLTPGDLSSGHFIAGTGEIDLQADLSQPPKVGAIGGILMKMIAARDAGATVFLVPADNCTEATTRIPDGLQLVKVATLDDAVAALKTLADGGSPPGC